MAERIYARVGASGFTPIAEERFSDEDEIQKLIAEHPELLDGSQIRPSDPRRWILVTREKGIAETTDAADRWAVDHLIIDQDAIPTLVEVKRGSNTEVRRTVVGQMLEYAAHAARSWTAAELRQAFEESCITQDLDPDVALEELLQGDEEIGLDADGFWQQVATNLAASRLRLLFVADDIPDSLGRVVEFLNAQMPAIEVLAVEIKQFRGRSMEALVPRVIGRPLTPERAPGTNPSRRVLTREGFLDELPSGQARNVAVRLMDVAEQNGAVLICGSAAVSVRMPCPLASPTSTGWSTGRRRRPAQAFVSVAWLVLPGRTVLHVKRDVSFGAFFGEESDPTLKGLLMEWAKQFSADDFAKKVGHRTWSITYDDAAQHMDLLAGRLAKILSELKSLCDAAPT